MTSYIRAALEGNEPLLDGPEHDDYCSIAFPGGKPYGMIHAFPPGVPRLKLEVPGTNGHASLDLHGLSLAQLRAVLAALRETP